MNHEVRKYLDSYKTLLVKNIEAIILSESKTMQTAIETEISFISVDSAEELKTKPLKVNTFENDIIHASKA